ncbi:MAG: OPT family oligopeptide transporter [Planctomycetota bacterium]
MSEPVPASSTNEEDTVAGHQPYVRAAESPAEFTIKAVVAGIIFGILFGAANAYLGLQAGLTISTSIPVAVMTVAAFRVLSSLGTRTSILEANLSQTIGSASSSVASGVIFTLPAMFMWGMKPELLQMTLLAMCGGLLGVLFMIPLRRYLIEKEHGKLPYPEGTACAEVLIASESGSAKARNVFLGLLTGTVFRFIVEWLKPFASSLKFGVPLLPKAQLGIKMSSSLFGVGFILGPRVGSIMVAGGLLSSLVIIPLIAWWGADRTVPLYPETEKMISAMSASEIWTRYVRYIGAGAVATAGLITLIRSIPTMIASFKIGFEQLKKRRESGNQAVLRTGLDLSLRTVGIAVMLIAIVLAAVPQVFGVFEGFLPRAIAAICVVVFAFFFVTVASRIVGLVGVTSNPTSGMTIASLLGTSTIFLLMGWTDATGMAGALAVGCVVAIAASIAGDTSQDLKTGFLLGATPRRQQIGELIGVLTSAVFVCLTVMLLDEAYTLGSEELAAPQATLMKVVIEGVLNAQLPWTLVAIGGVIAIVVELLKLPSLAFAVGVYLPVSTMVPVFLGGSLRWLLKRRRPRRATGEENDSKETEDKGVLFGSGLVGGEGLLGVFIAAIVFYQKIKAENPAIKQPLPGQIDPDWVSAHPGWSSSLAVVLMLIFVYVFARCCARSPKAS